MTTGSNDRDLPTWPTWQQVIDALNALHQDPRVHEGWRGMAGRLRYDRKLLAGLETARARLATDDTDDDAEDTVIPLAVVIASGYDTARGLVEAEWLSSSVTYSRRAHLALQYLAEGTSPPDWPWLLPGENKLPPRDLYGSPIGLSLAEVQIPAPFEDLPLRLLRTAITGIAHLHELADDYEDAFWPEDEETGQRNHSVPEQQIEEADAMEEELNTWPEANLTYGDAVAYTLATELADRMRTETRS
jgi:hypothetical protein